jgi:hypothetical protein
VQFQWTCLASDMMAIQLKTGALFGQGQWQLRDVAQETLDLTHVRLTMTAFVEHGQYDQAAWAIQQAMTAMPVANFSWRKL